jgi:antitoxin HicB
MMTNRRDVGYYMRLPYRIEMVPNLDEGGFDVAIPDLKGCVAWGETKQEALDTLEEVKSTWLEIALDRGWPIPEPATTDYREYSGRFNVRLPRYLHRSLARCASMQRTSLNQLAVALLGEGLGRIEERLAADKVETKVSESPEPTIDLLEKDYQEECDRFAPSLGRGVTYVSAEIGSDLYKHEV